MKEKESQATDQNDQPAESEQQAPASRNGVFLMRGKGQSWEEFVKICIQSLKDAGLIKEGSRPPKAGSDHVLNGQNLPDKKHQI